MKPSEQIIEAFERGRDLHGNRNHTDMAICGIANALNKVGKILDELDERMKKLEANPPTP